MSHPPPLRFLHSRENLIRTKLDHFRGVETADLIASLSPGCPTCLKCRPDGTLLDGHHRLMVLAERGHDINDLPREIIEKTDES